MSIDKNGIVSLLTFSGTISGIEHLWFIPTILFCYLLAPILSEILNAIDKRSDLRFGVEVILLLLIVHEVIKRFFGAFTPAWINCFVIGMIYSKLKDRGIVRRVFDIVVTVLCLIIIPIQFRIDYWPHGDLPIVLSSRYGHFVQYGHVFLGIAFVIIIRFAYNKLGKKQSNFFVLNWSDKYSYDVYLVHHIFVQSAFGVVEFISNRYIALPLAILLTIVSSILLCMFSNLIRNVFNAGYRRIPN